MEINDPNRGAVADEFAFIAARDMTTSHDMPPRIGVKVLGFAPFKITGWNFSGNSQPNPDAPACNAINLLTHPSASIGRNGIQGYFVKSMTTDPDFTYLPTEADLCTNDFKLSEWATDMKAKPISTINRKDVAK